MKRRTARTGMSGRQLLVVQAAMIGGLAMTLFVRELPGIVRELRIYRMTGGLRANRRYP
ncbi:hypothetical protein SRB17_44480 [Streptomyces sp. RB17]|uniref:hypothetical protein n=1 Tax=Streptomyces sp. RB17 TaxID=2585197 RepID=UPI0012955B2B|nr:hypothetical protein [Streptomyces sp. RB17]MQY36447.1 hypothetical protein [Streptomyces sp. RB17]